MVGGQIRDKDHVWAIAFPLEKTTENLYPANARGLLQVIREFEHEKAGQLSQPQFDLEKRLSNQEQSDLADTHRPSYEFAQYNGHYSHYCNLSIEFIQQTWSEKDFMSKIAEDWNPLGFSTHQTTAGNAANKACQITEWKTAIKEYSNDFGARTFLIRNLLVKSITDVRMMRFDEPKYQRIPDIVAWP